MVFSIFTALCTSKHCLISEPYHPVGASVIPSPSPQPLVPADLLPFFPYVPSRDISHTWNMGTCVLRVWVHTCVAGVSTWFLFMQFSSIPSLDHTTLSPPFSHPSAAIGLFHLLAVTNNDAVNIHVPFFAWTFFSCSEFTVSELKNTTVIRSYWVSEHQ